jgi:hypothetical protein
MRKIKKSIIEFSALMLMFVGLTFSQGVTCTKIFGIYAAGTYVEYWCCTGPEGCFWDVYQLEQV